MFRTMSIVALLLITLAGCASPRTMSRDEWLQASTRTYTDVSKDQFFAAAEELFRLADGDDFQVAYPDADQMVATRRWTVYMVLAFSMGTDTWLVRATDESDGLAASVAVSTGNSGAGPMMTTGGDWTVTGAPGAGAIPVQGTAIYEIFWARMDYLLGKSPDWMTCEEAIERAKTKVVWGNNEALCNLINVKDRTPESSVVPVSG
ncbi:hypothetical protein [Virgifigura deserti]|uniref:hypothetical protein n=1 Tax=Virgifigura deserti TaxID=2268457 RepID=UPI003CCBBF16